MKSSSVPEHRVIVTPDIEDYSSRNDAEQRVLQSALSVALDEAANAACLDRQSWLRQVSGDGVFAVLPRDTDIAALMDVFVRELDAALGSHNRRRADDHWTRMRLRLAVHVGPVHLDGALGLPGQHAVLPARLRDSVPVRAALAELPDADLAVIVSTEVYRDFITQGPGEPRPSDFRPVHVRVKKQAYDAYLYVPRYDIHDLPIPDGKGTPESGAEERHDDPLPPATSPAAPTVGGQYIVTQRNEASGSGTAQSAGRDFYIGRERDR
ncbi:hypothetical protein LUW76_08390 [Actinomadura madurae]|uniref:hypothetical protein n=1 Tax=Actinomadura madurae TaxID=1993 RepID=UPI0020268B9D|nr:hypothetical protein [Actinomadura madurae]URM94349.1 hypothetical protein LUW76_08390 [Actinomadura madurae]